MGVKTWTITDDRFDEPEDDSMRSLVVLLLGISVAVCVFGCLVTTLCERRAKAQLQDRLKNNFDIFDDLEKGKEGESQKNTSPTSSSSNETARMDFEEEKQSERMDENYDPVILEQIAAVVRQRGGMIGFPDYNHKKVQIDSLLKLSSSTDEQQQQQGKVPPSNSTICTAQSSPGTTPERKKKVTIIADNNDKDQQNHNHGSSPTTPTTVTSSLPSLTSMSSSSSEWPTPSPPPAIKKSHQPICPVCSNNLEKGDQIFRSNNPACDHMVHRLCLIEWLIKHDHCPSCKEKFCVPAKNSNNKNSSPTTRQKNHTPNNHNSPTSTLENSNITTHNNHNSPIIPTPEKSNTPNNRNHTMNVKNMAVITTNKATQ